MFDRRMFAGMRRAGMAVGVSKSKLSQAMLEILVQLHAGTADLKETFVAHLGLIGVLDKDLSAANLKKLNELADAEKCSVNQIVSKLIRHYKRQA